MDPDRRTAMRLRADEAMKAALAAADSRAPSLAVFIEDTMASINLVSRDSTLGLRERLLLIDDMLPLIASLKKLLGAAPAARPGMIIEIGTRTNALLRRYARLVNRRADWPGPARGPSS